jgi:hypothetical protein
VRGGPQAASNRFIHSAQRCQPRGRCKVRWPQVGGKSFIFFRNPRPDAALARRLLQDPLPRRWAHTQGVATKAAAIAMALTHDPDVLIGAAWLHDIGYTPAIASAGTGFHPLDGARYLRDTAHAEPIVCRLVAHHSRALDGAAQLGLADDLASEFPRPPEDLADALTYCDMTTSPDGQPVPVEKRLAEICARYGPGHTVTRATTESAPHITAAVRRVSGRLAACTAETTRSRAAMIRSDREHPLLTVHGPGVRHRSRRGGTAAADLDPLGDLRRVCPGLDAHTDRPAYPVQLAVGRGVAVTEREPRFLGEQIGPVPGQLTHLSHRSSLIPGTHAISRQPRRRPGYLGTRQSARRSCPCGHPWLRRGKGERASPS